MFVPKWVLIAVALLVAALTVWTWMLASDRNPLPFPDAEVVRDVEPDLPIAFVVTDAMPGTVLNFRKHLMHFPKPQPVPRG